MRSTHPENQTGPRPAWNGVGMAIVALFVVMFVLLSPPPPAAEEESPAPTISLDDLRAMLTDAPGETPPTLQVQTPDGPVTVVVPTTRPAPRTTTTTTRPPTTTTTTSLPPPTTVPRTPRDPNDVMADFLEDLTPGPPSTVPGGAGER